MKGYAQGGDLQKMESAFQGLLHRKLAPNAITFNTIMVRISSPVNVFLLKDGAVRAGRYEYAPGLLVFSASRGFNPMGTRRSLFEECSIGSPLAPYVKQK